MRTTLTIEDSIMQRLKEEAYRNGSSLKQVINTALDLGLRHFEEQPPSLAYKLKTFSMGFPPRVNFDKALQIASNLEDEEIGRKLEMRK
ncbi:MAG: DUF2191 domain-containing protein [SAR324 cluster bacterium]|nr:DUF2191 domain-containing protein [SAR324 cluster bacterium]